MSESANPMATNNSAASAVLAALLKWQTGRLTNAQLQAFVRETLASATPDLLHRFESCGEDDESFREVCEQLIQGLTGSESKVSSDSVQIPVPGPQMDSQTLIRAERPSFSHTKPLDIEFLPDVEEPVEVPRRVFDPVMGLQTVDGFIRFTTYDYLSVPRLIMAACIGTVCALPWLIENPEFSKDPGYNVYGPKPAALAGTKDIPSDAPTASFAGIGSEDQPDSSAVPRVEVAENEATSPNAPSISDAPQVDPSVTIDEPNVLASSDEAQGPPASDAPVIREQSETDLASLAEGDAANDVSDTPVPETDLESLLAPYASEGEVAEAGDSDSDLQSQILEQLQNRDFASVAKTVPSLANGLDTKKWLSAEIALRQQGPEARLAAWSELLDSPSTELIDDLLCARLLLTSSSSERSDFLRVARDLETPPTPDSGSARYIRWALSWSKRADRDVAGEITRYASDQVSRASVDAIFAANASFAKSDVSTAYTQLVDSQISLQSMQSATTDDISNWIHGESVEDLSKRVRRTLKGLSGRLTTAPR
ncbi:MAG: hypothetical protein AAGG44_01660 [Planctomycetota bacterium]